MILKFDDTLQEYYYVNDHGDITFDSPKEVKIKRKNSGLKSFSFNWNKLIKKISRPDKNINSNNNHSQPTISYQHETSYQSDEPQSESESFSDTISYQSLITPTNSNFDEARIFSHDYDYDSDLQSIDSNDVSSFNGDYQLTNFYNATTEDIDMNYHHYYDVPRTNNDDFLKSFEIYQLRQDLLKELEL